MCPGEDREGDPQLFGDTHDCTAGSTFPSPSFMVPGSREGPQPALSRDHAFPRSLPFVIKDDAYVMFLYSCYREVVL